MRLRDKLKKILLMNGLLLLMSTLPKLVCKVANVEYRHRDIVEHGLENMTDMFFAVLPLYFALAFSRLHENSTPLRLVIFGSAFLPVLLVLLWLILIVAVIIERFIQHPRDPLDACISFLVLSIYIVHIYCNVKCSSMALSIRIPRELLQREEDRLAEPQTKNCPTNLMDKKILTRVGQEVLDKSVTQHHNENVHIEEVIYDMQKLEKRMSDLRLRKPNLELQKEGQQKKKKLERKEQLKVNEQKLKQELPDANNERRKFKMDVKQQLHSTVQPKLNIDHQGLNMNQGQSKIAPEEKACNTRAMDMAALSEIHHVHEPPSTQSYGRNMYTDNQQDKDKTCNTRPMDMTHLEERSTTQLYNANMNKSINENYELKKEKEEHQKQSNSPKELLKYYSEQIKRKEDEIVRQLQREGQLCKMNCVALAIRWICKNKTEVKIPGCACQLEIVITLFALGNSKLDPKDLKCGHFMERLSGVGIVKLPKDNEYVLVGEVKKELVIVKAWEKLMAMNQKVCILGTRNSRPGFADHVVVIDLDTRTSRTRDGKVMFHDPQAPQGEREAEMSLKDFITYVHDSDGLRLYTVNLKELNKIMVYHKDELHNTEETSDNV